MPDRRRWLNCGTVMAGLGFAVFAFFGAILLRMLCEGTGGATASSLPLPG